MVAFIFGITAGAVSAKVENYSSTISMFRGSPAVAKFFKHSYGYAVFPIISKAGYAIGDSYGKGQVYRGGKVTGKSTVIERSIGFQVGTAGASADPKSDVQAETDYVKGFATFVHAKGGLMAGVSIGGEKLTYERL